MHDCERVLDFQTVGTTPVHSHRMTFAATLALREYRTPDGKDQSLTLIESFDVRTAWRTRLVFTGMSSFATIEFILTRVDFAPVYK